MSSRIAGGVAILLALIGLVTGDTIGKGHEHAATIYLGAIVLVGAGVFAMTRPSRVMIWLVTGLVVAYVAVLGATFVLNRP